MCKLHKQVRDPGEVFEKAPGEWQCMPDVDCLLSKLCSLHQRQRAMKALVLDRGAWRCKTNDLCFGGKAMRVCDTHSVRREEKMLVFTDKGVWCCNPQSPCLVSAESLGPEVPRQICNLHDRDREESDLVKVNGQWQCKTSSPCLKIKAFRICGLHGKSRSEDHLELMEGAWRCRAEHPCGGISKPKDVECAVHRMMRQPQDMKRSINGLSFTCDPDNMCRAEGPVTPSAPLKTYDDIMQVWHFCWTHGQVRDEKDVDRVEGRWRCRESTKCSAAAGVEAPLKSHGIDQEWALQAWRVCSDHKVRRLDRSLDFTEGKWHCRNANKKCDEHERMMCSVHKRLRKKSNMEMAATGQWLCKLDAKCNLETDDENVGTCRIHGIKRSTEQMEIQEDGTSWECRLDAPCNLKAEEFCTPAVQKPDVHTRVMCSKHEQYRFVKSLVKLDNNDYVCTPEDPCISAAERKTENMRLVKIRNDLEFASVTRKENEKNINRALPSRHLKCVKHGTTRLKNHLEMKREGWVCRPRYPCGMGDDEEGPTSTPQEGAPRKASW